MGAEGVFTTGTISSYCSVEDVLKVLRGYDLTAFGGEAELAARIQELLPAMRGMLESGARRDFLWHADQTVTLDGTGSERLQVLEAGVKPPLYVKAVRVEGQALAAGAYHAYAETGLIRLKPTATLAAFPAGVQNVTVDLDWGYEVTPAEIGLAQAKLTAAELLAELGGEGGAVQETRIGDYTVRYASQGRYAGAVAQLVAEAEDVVRRYRMVVVGAV